MPAGEFAGYEDPGVRLTYDDFLLFPEDGNRHELIDGEHCVSPAPNIKHQQISVNLTVIIGSWLDANPIGHVFHAPVDTVLSFVDVVEPDLVYVSRERSAFIAKKHLTGAPDLVVEITSKATRNRDQTAKLRLYERSGVQEYWIVDPDIEVVRVHRRRGNGFGVAGELVRGRDDVLTSPIFPGLELPLERIFRNT
jgi:Uma2 family endonuclease